ncbi:MULTISPECIES: class I SAM-dependent methyltransferase [unclassified Streptomyces]|uniref:class I SAM-dependent methyltransferase n=1 Tax=unclassified Streptomyces TaxID=2593676 RepID=UPI002DDAD8F0|nr:MULTISPECIES: class I SAM-dependent methyltransferase [unclassified Streptomyces]WSA95581.1 class I SAM-dependent methyltransferase [Streptomyces sp. NBC_01795]WSB79999.1 class I SAM-dependent methyltransferase [Streptomyces sp. NBC_01775]WSS11794.1 class I SAM-dependent methyltransferase [Streptomyces sp. NBC_01186]WSS40507.1 class I SAM-dependent methyltransferase [Streptomyces sp. NBC_01187]
MPHDATSHGGPRARARAGSRARQGLSSPERLRHTLLHPARLAPYARRMMRDWWLRRGAHGDHITFYRGVMRSDVARNPNAAVGTPTQERWEAVGELQFSYLRSHGLQPSHRLLEIGCGNLRAGWRFIDYLAPGHYYGLDISPDILFAAQRVLASRGLQGKLPHLTLVDDMRLAHLPEGHFDMAHAHSVFSHSPPQVIEECLSHIPRVLKPGGFFDFTYNRTDGEEHHVLHEDFYYRPATLIALAESQGLLAATMDDWDELPHRQSKIRATLPRAYVRDGE